MDIYSKIDEIFDIIQDPRNIDPNDFEEFYPEAGEKYNSKNLTKKEIGLLFENRHKFKRPNNWRGYKPLISKYHLLVALCEKSTKDELDTISGYLASRCIKNTPMITFDYLEQDQLLSSQEIGEITGMYTVFYKTLLSDLTLDIEACHKTSFNSIEQEAKNPNIDNPYPNIFKPGIGFQVFQKYKEKYIVDPYLDHSFLFQSLKKRDLIYEVKQRKYIEWLCEKEFISPKQIEKFTSKGEFYVYGRCNAASRINNFNLILNEVECN